MKRKRIQSWTGVFKVKANVLHCNSIRDLYEAFKFPAKIIGSLHSYNQMPLAPRVVKLGKAFEHINVEDSGDLVTVGAATRIKDLMNHLVKHNLRLPNSGNHREQTIAGALIGGTHGFGKSAAMADSVFLFEGLWRKGDDIIPKVSMNPSDLRHSDLLCVTKLTLKVIPCTSFRVDNCVCRLSDIKPHSKQAARAYAVLPYSGKDPVCTIADYTPVTDIPESYKTKRTLKKALPWKWWRLKVWWALDRFFPPLRRVVQRALGLINMKPFTLYTHKYDIDALYDPFPGPDGRDGNLKFTRWAYRPTYTCYNISLFVRPQDVKGVIKYAMYEADYGKRTLLRCFIGVRELSDRSEVSFAGNYEGPVSAIDLYCTPKHADHLIRLQRKIQNRFWTRPHYGKTVFQHKEILKS